MKTNKTPAKQIKPRVMWAEHTLNRPLESTNTLRFSGMGLWDHCVPCAVIPCDTRKHAAALVKWHSLTREDRAERMAKHLGAGCGNGEPYDSILKDQATAILNLTEPNT